METCSMSCGSQKVINEVQHTCKRHPKIHDVNATVRHVCVCGRSWIGDDDE